MPMMYPTIDVPKLLEVIKSDNKLNRVLGSQPCPIQRHLRKHRGKKRKERKRVRKERRKQIRQIRVLRLKNRQKERRWKACATERVKVLKNN